MPLPTPKGKESKDDFISRCVADSKTREEAKDNKQAVAMCNSQWERSKKENVLEQIKKELDFNRTFVEGVDTKPTQEMADIAQQALDKKEDSEISNESCATEVGMNRARQLANREDLSEKDINDMVSFFSRHDGNQKINEGIDNKWEDCGYVAWQLWGGDPGRDFAERKQEEIENMKKENSLSKIEESINLAKEAKNGTSK